MFREEPGTRSATRMVHPKWGEPPVPRADVALRVGVHGGVAGVPEEPDVLF